MGTVLISVVPGFVRFVNARSLSWHAVNTLLQVKGHNILQNLHHRFVQCSGSQIYIGDFAKFCGLLRISELYLITI